MRSTCFGSSGPGLRLYPSSLIRLANDIPCSPSRAATASSVALTPSCGVTAAQAGRYSCAADSASDTALSSPRYDGLSDMVPPWLLPRSLTEASFPDQRGVRSQPSRTAQLHLSRRSGSEREGAAAVHRDRLAGDPRGARAGQGRHHPRRIVRFAGTADEVA